MSSLLSFAGAAFALAFVATPLCRRAVLALGVVDVPNERSSHVQPTPRSGGIAILLPLALPLAFASNGQWRVALLLTVVIAGVGLADDVRPLGAGVRLVVHVAAAGSAVVWGGFVLRAVTVPPSVVLSLGAFAIPLTLLFIVGLTNAYNFMDGINGIASVEAIVAGAALAYLLLQGGDRSGAAIAIAVAAAAAGFLPWNFPRATIFMGDVGSGALGFLLAILVVRYSADGGSIVAAVLPLLPFILDTSVTLLRRFFRRERVFAAHRSHFYQRLNILGWTHARVTSLCGGLAVGGAVVSVAWSSLTPSAQFLAAGAVVTLNVIVGVGIAAAERMHRRNTA